MNNSYDTSYDKLSTASKFAFISVAIFFWAAILFIENWLLMIFIGTLHSIFSSIPAAGFWTVLWFNLLVGTIINITKKNMVK